MDEKVFVTQTVPKSSWAYFGVITVLLAAAFAAAYYLLPQFGNYIFIAGALVCISFLGTGLILASGPPVRLRFKNDDLYILDSSGKEYHVYAVPASDFVFMQTPLEKKYDIGCLRIKHTVFWMLGVQNVQETKRYIDENFPHW